MNPLASTKCAGRLLMALAATTSILLMAACGSSGSVGTRNPVGFGVGSLSGTYVFSASGTDVANETFFAIAGTIDADGKGNITKGGSFDLIDPKIGVFPDESLSASTYSVGTDGRGSATLATPQGNLVLDFVLTSSEHGLVTRFGTSGT